MWRSDPPALDRARAPMLPYAFGRSYGDSCLNDGGLLLDVRRLDRLIAFDETEGRLRCEAGVTLAEILALSVPRGWFLPVVPGTRWVSIGGAVANDIHGKNHHRAGSFGAHVTRLELLRSTGERIVCAPGDELFHATVGGLGLTGLILWAEIRLTRIPGPGIAMERIRFDGLDGFFELAAEDARARVHRRVGRLSGARPPAGARPLPAGRPRAVRGRRAVPAPAVAFSRARGRARRAAQRRHPRAVQRGLLSVPAPHHPPDDGPVPAVLLSARQPRRLDPALRPPGLRAVSVRGARRARRRAPSACSSTASAARASPRPWRCSSGSAPCRSTGLLSFARPGLTLAVDFAVRGPTHPRAARRPRRGRARRRRRRVSGQGRPHEPRELPRLLPGPRPVQAASRSATSPPPSGGGCMATEPRRVLIVGATSAIAGETARVYAAYGARLFLTGRHAERLEAVAADLRVRGAIGGRDRVAGRHRSAALRRGCRAGLAGVRRAGRGLDRPRRPAGPGARAVKRRRRGRGPRGELRLGGGPADTARQPVRGVRDTGASR